MKTYASTLLALLLLLSSSVSAQTVTALGTRVQVSTNNGRHSGLLLAVSGDSLLIGFSDRPTAPVTRARSDVTSLRASLGGDGWRGAIIGGQLGIVVGSIGFGVEHVMSRSSDPRFHYDNVDVASAAVSGAIWGFLGGAVMGAIIGEERWENAVLPSGTAALPSAGERSGVQMQARLGLFEEGTGIRLRTQDGRLVQGRYDGHTNDFVRIVADSSYAVPIATIREISERRPLTGPWLKRGMWLGAALGAALVAGAALNEEDCDPDSCLSAWAYLPAGTITGAFSGAVLGSTLGSHVKGWRPQKW